MSVPSLLELEEMEDITEVKLEGAKKLMVMGIMRPGIMAETPHGSLC